MSAENYLTFPNEDATEEPKMAAITKDRLIGMLEDLLEVINYDERYPDQTRNTVALRLLIIEEINNVRNVHNDYDDCVTPYETLHILNQALSRHHLWAASERVLEDAKGVKRVPSFYYILPSSYRELDAQWKRESTLILQSGAVGTGLYTLAVAGFFAFIGSLVQDTTDPNIEAMAISLTISVVALLVKYALYVDSNSLRFATNSTAREIALSGSQQLDSRMTDIHEYINGSELNHANTAHKHYDATLRGKGDNKGNREVQWTLASLATYTRKEKEATLPPLTNVAPPEAQGAKVPAQAGDNETAVSIPSVATTATHTEQGLGVGNVDSRVENQEPMLPPSVTTAPTQSQSTKSWQHLRGHLLPLSESYISEATTSAGASMTKLFKSANGALIQAPPTPGNSPSIEREPSSVSPPTQCG